MTQSAGAPVFLYNKYAKGGARNFSQYVQHPRHSTAIKNKCEELGLDTEMMLKHDSPGIDIIEVHDRMLKFFLKHFNKEKYTR